MSDGETATAARRLAIGIFEPSQDRLARLSAWYSIEHDKLVRFAYLLTRNLDFAEDLVQDAFIRMYRVRDPLDESGYTVYARRVIVNLARSAFRRRVIERSSLRRLFRDDAVERDYAGEIDVRRALMALSVRDRACLALRYYDGQTDAGVASTLGISQAAAKKRVARAHGRLRKLLKEES